MDSPPGHRITAALLRRTGPGGSASAVAGATVGLWRDVAAQLSPILGARGVAALYARALYLASHRHPWLGSAPDAFAIELELDGLRARIASRAAPGALEGSVESLRQVHDLLTSLVGPMLTERMLGPVWDYPVGGESARNAQR